MNKVFDYKEIAKELDFTENESKILVDSMLSLADLTDRLNNTNDIIQCWNDSCYRANDLTEIMQDYAEIVDTKEIGHRIFILNKNKLAVIGLWC